MIIEFEYTADVGWLSDEERKNLVTALKKCTYPKNWDYIDVTRKHISLGGTLTDEDDLEDYKDIEFVLDDFDLEWDGGIEEKEPAEPDWDSMQGGYDYEFSKSLDGR